MNEPIGNTYNELLEKYRALEAENRKLNRESKHLATALQQEKTAAKAALNRQKTATLAQRQRDRYLALVLDNFPGIILFLTETLRVDFCTNFVVRKTGYSSALDLKGRTLAEIFSGFMNESESGALFNYCKQTMASGQPVSFEITFDFNQGLEDYEGTLISMKDSEDETSGLMLMLHDITDLKHSREQAF